MTDPVPERLARMESIVSRQVTVLDRLDERLRAVEARVAESRPLVSSVSTIAAGVVTAIAIRILLGC